MKALAPGKHMCLVYESKADQMAAVGAFFRESLAENYRCIYLVEETSLPELRAAFSSAGIDCEAAEARGALLFVSARESYLQDGKFDPEAMVALLREIQRQALADGFAGSRSGGEMTWALEADVTMDELLAYEVRLNEVLPLIGHTGICQYNRDRFEAELLIEVVKRHPFAIHGQLVSPNPFYEPPDLLLRHPPEKRLDWMLERLEDAHRRELVQVEANEKLKELSQLKDNFLSVVSHELRTPLNFITGFASLLHDEVVGPLSARQQDYVGKILHGADRMLVLVNNLLDMSRMAAGRFAIAPQPTGYRKLVEEAVAMLTPLADERGLSLGVEVGFEGRVDLDPERITQVLTNLVQNAIKFTPQGGSIRVSAFRREEELVTEVTDTGYGIAASNLQKLFTPFGQLDMSATRKVGGTGLGLSISKALVEAHGGQIGARSGGRGKGSTFWFTLPLKE